MRGVSPDPARSEGGSTETLRGTVVSGDRRGRDLGYPTANLRLGRPAPKFGIYAGRALGRPAAVSIGVRPTFGDDLEPLVEVHILDFEGDLYGQEVTVELLAYLRPEQQFDSEQALVAQIELDVQRVRDLVGAPG